MCVCMCVGVDSSSLAYTNALSTQVSRPLPKKACNSVNIYCEIKGKLRMVSSKITMAQYILSW